MTNTSPTLDELTERSRGVLLGTALGDALGLPYEALSPRRQRRLRGDRALSPALFAGRGFLSDDSEQTFLLCQRLRIHSEPHAFARSLAWGLRLWLLRLPAATGLATGRAILKLWLGVPPEHSGVYSAGNGAAMRASPIGVKFSNDDAMLFAFTRASTRLTHRDPAALTGALAVARTVASYVRQPRATPLPLEPWLDMLRGCAQEDDPTAWHALIDQLATHLRQQSSLEAFVEALGLHKKGVTGYVYHTVPVALFALHRHHHEPELALTRVIERGGDTDTVAAILGALLGASHGTAWMPRRWTDTIRDYPLTLDTLDASARALVNPDAAPPRDPSGFLFLFRNLCFLIIVLAHGFRRLLPPY